MLKKLLLCMLGGCALFSAAAAEGRFEPRPQMERSAKIDGTKKQIFFENGKAKFEIVVGKSRWALLAGEELSKVLHKSLGVKIWPHYKRTKPQLPAIIIGDVELCKKAGFDPDKIEWGGFRIKTAGKDILIAGRDEGEHSEGSLGAAARGNP